MHFLSPKYVLICSGIYDIIIGSCSKCFGRFKIQINTPLICTYMQKVYVVRSAIVHSYHSKKKHTYMVYQGPF